MPANVGEMFYTGEMPWHREGTKLEKPATLEEALIAGGLDWEVGEVEILTNDDPPSPVPMRRAIVRLDRPAGNRERVLGVVHPGFKPVQNRSGAELFDKLFGRDKPVYHTGGYLGRGEAVWLLAKIDKELEIVRGDVVQPYLLFANSHDGSVAVNIRLTTVRVVCRNTLAAAVGERRFGKQFRRRHQGTLETLAIDAEAFFAATIRELDEVESRFKRFSQAQCPNDKFEDMVVRLMPVPQKPHSSDRNPTALKAWETRVHNILEARRKIGELRQSGRGMELDGSRGTCWGALNAITEFVDHHQKGAGSRMAHALLGEGMDLKARAYAAIYDIAKAA